MPIGGKRDGSEVYSVGSSGFVWSSSLVASVTENSYDLNLRKNGSVYVRNQGGRYSGFAIRGVCM